MLTARRITKDELAKTGELFRIAFEFPDPNAKDNDTLLAELEKNPGSRRAQFPTEKWAAFDEEGNMAAWIGGARFYARFDGHVFPMSGIGGVSSLPQYRKQGGIRKCFEKQLRDNYNDGVVLSYLYPFSTKFYGKFGYEPTGKVAYYTIPLRGIDPQTVGGVVKPHYMGNRKADIIKVYDEYMSKFNFACVRDEYDWKYLDESDMSKSGHYIYVWYNNAGEAKGVIGFKKEKDKTEKFNLQTGNMFWYSDAEGLRGLLEFARGFEVYYRNLVIKVPADCPINAYVREWAMYPQECAVYSMGMARIINVKEALKAAKYRGCGSIKIAVEDEHLPENSKTFAVTFENDRATEVTETEEAADVEMSIAMFSKFIVGDKDVFFMTEYPGVKVNCCEEKWQKVFYPKQLFILDMF